MNTKFTKTRSVKDLAISLSAIVSGSIIVAIPSSGAVNITGFFLLCTGLLLFFILKTGWKENATGERYGSRSYYFAKEDEQQVRELLTHHPAGLKSLDGKGASSLKVDLFFSKKAGKAWCMIYEYVPYEYQPSGEACEFKYADIEPLIK